MTEPSFVIFLLFISIDKAEGMGGILYYSGEKMKKIVLVIIGLLCLLALSSCETTFSELLEEDTSVLEVPDDASVLEVPEDTSLLDVPEDTSELEVPKETPASFEEEKSKTIVPAIGTTHAGTLRDPVPIGEYREWGIYNEDRLSELLGLDSIRTDYTIRLNVNYAVRGEQVLDLYNAYTKEMKDYEATTSSYHYDGYERYIPKPGNELILINITMEVDSDENRPLSLDPSNFNIASSSGVKFSSGKDYDRDYFKYLNLFDYSIYPGGKAVTGNLIYEVPKNQEVLLEFVEKWFETE